MGSADSDSSDGIGGAVPSPPFPLIAFAVLSTIFISMVPGTGANLSFNQLGTECGVPVPTGVFNNDNATHSGKSAFGCVGSFVSFLVSILVFQLPFGVPTFIQLPISVMMFIGIGWPILSLLLKVANIIADAVP